ncbi:carboxylic ester hydrolase-like [Andrena cerasifolii]|uniref:carboxylic ester hydrolase-like n=1 Tax=Andrena cerasifolii TaxID=2819439 RepID=UPI004038389D
MTRLPIILLFLGFVNSWQKDVPRVQTDLGDISGFYKKSWGGEQYAAYEGIPYAQPPVGNLRFQPPEPVQRWDGELKATKKGSICTQYLMSPSDDGDRVTGCEDCLYMNIYVPVRNSSKGLWPVMFWIHGGGFQFGSGNEADETRLMDRDVIFVTFNYRLGPFGFLSTGNHVVPGNMGLKDQSMALRWVSKHIKNVGGDPDNVMLFGLSAGGASVQFHYLSPFSAGLFQRGISISGVALDPWAQTERAPEKADKLGAILGCPTNTTTRMINCLRERPARLISQAVGDFMYWLYNPVIPFGPVVEKQVDPGPFINRSPVEVISRGEAMDVPWITGVMSEEGLYPAAEFVANDTRLKELNDNWNDIAPYLLDFNDTIPLSDHANVSEKIRKHYLGDKEIKKETVLPLIHMIGDRQYGVGCERAARLQAKANKSPVWTYYYSYRAMHSVSEVLSGSTENFGVSHGDDILLVLNSKLGNTTRAEDHKMQQVLLNFLTSFAITGKPRIPNDAWGVLNPDEKVFRYLHVASPQNVTMEDNDDFAEKKFWNTIPFEENQLSSNPRGSN